MGITCTATPGQKNGSVKTVSYKNKDTMNQLNPTQRFSDRVENYIKYRPSYPEKIMALLRSECGLTQTSLIADIGSGTGILSELFLKNGNTVFGIEPNDQMRAAGEKLLAKHDRFISVNGSAEATTLANQIVDFITAAQAFHWFDRENSRREFTRILKTNGWVVLVWNDRKTDSTPFLNAYEQLLLTHSLDYEKVNHRQIDHQVIRFFFGSNTFKVATFENYQQFDFIGLKGRLLSSSYVPTAGHPKYQAMIDDLVSIFDKHQVDGKVTIEYETIMYYGQLLSEGT